MVYSGAHIDYNEEYSANSKPHSIQSRIPNLALGAWSDPRYKFAQGIIACSTQD